MDPFSMVLGIVFISVAGGVVGQALKTRQRALELQSRQPVATTAEAAPDALLREIASLRARVAALEAIVTEPSYELKHKFRELERDAGRQVT